MARPASTPTVRPSFRYEDALAKEGFLRIAGIDEAGRGPWAGPVVAAAVVLDASDTPDHVLDALNDSKKLSKPRREHLYPLIMETAQVGVGEASAEEIDEINILQATFLAMRRAVADLPQSPNACLVDGNLDPNLNLPTRTLVKGDSLSLSIAAASIIAKVTRDRIMADLSQLFPQYGWEKNAGYGVPAHREALSLVGPSPHHRKSFAPIRESLREDSLIEH